MKKSFLLFAFILTLTTAYSQKASLGINAGLNFTKASMPLYGKIQSNNYEPNYHIGALVDIDFGAFSLQPGLVYTTKGGATKPDSVKITSAMPKPAIGNSRLVIQYFEVPLSVVYKIQSGSGNFFVGGGPYFALAAGAYSSFKGTYLDNSESATYDLTIGKGQYDRVKRGDFGFNIMAGYKYKSGYTLNAGFGNSLTNIRESDGSVKNQSFSLSVGRFF